MFGGWLEMEVRTIASVHPTILPQKQTTLRALVQPLDITRKGPSTVHSRDAHIAVLITFLYE